MPSIREECEESKGDEKMMNVSEWPGVLLPFVWAACTVVFLVCVFFFLVGGIEWWWLALFNLCSWWALALEFWDIEERRKRAGFED